ncbi:hypothetical protein MBLNU459_g6527t1 [Dothideomycetes sp. NU459]
MAAVPLNDRTSAEIGARSTSQPPDSIDHQPERLEPRLPTWRFHSLCLGLFLSLLDTSIVATALYSIGADFGALNIVTWVALAYTLSYVGTAVIFTRLGDVFGRRNAVIAAFVIFLAFSLGCGFSQSVNQLIACRALQGVGGAGLYSLAMVVFLAFSPPGMQPYIAGMIGAVVAIAGVLGPVLGGVLTHYTTWRWIFWINLPIGVPAMALFCISWPRSDQARHAERRPLRELDWIGCFLVIAASVLVVFSFEQAGIRTDVWKNAIFLAPLLVGCLCWVLLFAWEITVSHNWSRRISPIMPLRLLKMRVYCAAAICTITTGFIYFVVIYALPIHFQIVNQRSPLSAGVGLLPMLGSAAVGSMLGGALSGKTNNIFQVLVAGSSLMVLGTGLLSTLSNAAHIEAKVYGFQVFIGLGFGLTVASVTILANLESSSKDHAVAQGIIAQARIFGGSLGIAASTAILGSVERRRLAGVVSEAQLASLQSSVETLSAAQYAAVRTAYADAFDGTLRATAIVACVGLLVTFGTYQRHPLSIEEGRKRNREEEDAREMEEDI